MIYTIKKGRHRARPSRFGAWFDRSVFRWKVSFFPSCRYDIGPDQTDINKLVGVGFAPWWKLLFVIAPAKFLGLMRNDHHKDSARFGWCFNYEKNKIEIHSYCYVNGQRKTSLITSVNIGEPVVLSLQVVHGSYIFYAGQYMHAVKHNHKKKFSYRLGTFFGGNQVAPHNILIELKKV